MSSSRSNIAAPLRGAVCDATIAPLTALAAGDRQRRLAVTVLAGVAVAIVAGMVLISVVSLSEPVATPIAGFTDSIQR